MAIIRRLNCASYVCLFVLMILVSGSRALISTPDVNLHYPKAISDLKEAIVKRFQSDNTKIFGFDLKDALVSRAMEFDLEVDNTILPIKLLEDVSKWEFADLPTFLVDDQVRLSDENGLVEKKQGSGKGLPTLPPFQLAGPMELWIEDAKDMRLFLPHDVDAGELKKVMLAEGAIVTVTGAKSVNLRHPVKLPLPFNKTNNTFASGLLSLSNHLRTQNQLLSIRIVGPTSLSSPATSPSSNKLKLKRLAPGLVELSTVPNPKNPLSTINPARLSTFWPITSMNGSNSNLRGLETLLSAVLGSTESKNGFFKVLKADISSQMFLKIGFGMEVKVAGNESVFEGYPEWRTKPESVRLHFEVLAKVDGEKIVPERLVQVEDPVTVEDTVVMGMGNVSMSKMPIVHLPFTPFAL